MSQVLPSERLRRVPGRLVIQLLILTMQKPTQQHIGNLEYNRLSSQQHCISLYLYGSVTVRMSATIRFTSQQSNQDIILAYTHIGGNEKIKQTSEHKQSALTYPSAILTC